MKTVAISVAVLCVPVVLTQGRPQQVYIRVTDAGGAPVPGLGAADFELRESGVARPVTRAVPAASVLRIAVLVDTSPLVAPIIRELRAGLGAFFDEAPPRHEIMFATLGRRFQVRVPTTDDYQKLKKSAEILLAEHDGGTLLLDGILEADDKFFRTAKDRQPVMVIVTTDNADLSKVRQDVLNRRMDEILRRGVTVHAIVIIPHPGESGNERDVCTNLTEATGGHLDILTGSASALPDRLKSLGARLADVHRRMSTEYEIDFVSEATTPQPLQITVSRPNIKIEFSSSRYQQ